jgi:hypothetical protein
MVGEQGGASEMAKAGEPDDGVKVHFEDVSRKVFGKYQFCTQVDGRWFSDEDFELGGGCGKLKRGAIPAPQEKDRSPYYPPPEAAIRRFLAWLRA